MSIGKLLKCYEAVIEDLSAKAGQIGSNPALEAALDVLEARYTELRCSFDAPAPPEAPEAAPPAEERD